MRILLALVLVFTLAGCGPTGYASCDEARKAGATPLHRGDSGWNPKLDRDGDGIACE